MLRITLMDGATREIPREEVVGIFPAEGMLRHPALRSTAAFCFGGKVYPVTGPMGDAAPNAPFASRPWILLFSDHAEMIRGMPQFDDEIDLHPRAAEPLAFPSAPAEDEHEAEEARLLAEVEELLKTA